MELEIKGKKYELNFGVKFVHLADDRLGLKNALNVEFGMALGRIIPSLKGYDTAVLSEVISIAATPSLSLNDADAYIDDPNTDIEALLKDVLKEMESANAVKLAAKKLKG